MAETVDDSGNISLLKGILKNPWAKLISALTIATAILTAGFKVGNLNRDLDCRMEKIEMKQQFNEQIQKANDECRELKVNQYSKSVSDLEELVKELKKNKNEK